MALKDDFKSFCKNIILDNLDEMETSAGEITKKLNSHYYGVTGDEESHLYTVGSVGRKTAIKGSSDLDIIFDLPDEVYKRFDAYESNGQSALLQEIKNVIKERYPKTDIRGDGQVVVIEFSKYTVELVPGFKQSDNRFKYPDTHEGGTWKFTDPLAEQEESQNCNIRSDGKYYDFCHMLRSWKNNIGFEFGGLLIDTLVYNHFSENADYSSLDYADYLCILQRLLSYLEGQNKDQSYWLAVGSNQQVKNTGDGEFVKKAESASKKISDALDFGDDINDVMREMFGTEFPDAEKTSNNSIYKSCYRPFKNTEEFIEREVPVDIRYRVRLDCKISQNGFRDVSLRAFLRDPMRRRLKHNKTLEFRIDYTNCPEPYSVYWKVRNVGEEAERRDCIRGQIERTNSGLKEEHTNFYGDHYVECYLIKNEVCVARGRIEVPIGWD